MKTFLCDGQEVVLTGRYADRELSTKNKQRFVEVKSIDATIKWTMFVDISSLLEVKQHD